MKRIVQRGLNYFLIGIFLIQATIFFIQSRKMKEEIQQLRFQNEELKFQNEELKDSINRINVECYSIKEHSEIK